MKSLAALLIVALAVHAEPADEAKAKSALALAKAKRERELVKAQVPIDCHTDYAVAAKEAVEKNKPLAVWVGVTCKDHPALRKALGEAVHCHVSEWRKSKEPGVIIQSNDGIDYRIAPDKLDKPETAEKVKALWARPAVPPVRYDLRIVEDLSKAKTRPQNVNVDGVWYTVHGDGRWEYCVECNAKATTQAAPCATCGAACQCGNCGCDEAKGLATLPAPPVMAGPSMRVTPIDPRQRPVYGYAPTYSGGYAAACASSGG